MFGLRSFGIFDIIVVATQFHEKMKSEYANPAGKPNISDKWDEWEVRNGRPFAIYRAHPLIGRGSVVHNWVPHAVVEKRFAKAFNIPLLTRVKWFLEDLLRRV